MLNKLKDFVQQLGSEQEPCELPQDERRLACAALMIEVAIVDQQFDADELASMKSVLSQRFDISGQEVDALVADAQTECENATSIYQFTRTVNLCCSRSEKYTLIMAMWSIAYADGNLDKYEEYIIRKVCDLLHLHHSDFIRAKLAARDGLSEQ